MTDRWSRVIRVEAWVNGRHTTIAAVVHPDQVAIVAGPGLTIEFQASVWRLLAMHVATRAGTLCRRVRDRG